MTLVHRSLVWVELNFVYCMHRGDGHMIIRAKLTLHHSVLFSCTSLTHIWRVNCRSAFPLLWFLELEQPVHMFLLRADFLSEFFVLLLSQHFCVFISIRMQVQCTWNQFSAVHPFYPGCSTSFLIHTQVYMSAWGTWHNLRGKPGPAALKCALKDITRCFVLANKTEINMFKVSLIKTILKYTEGLIFLCRRIKPNCNIFTVISITA